MRTNTFWKLVFPAVISRLQNQDAETVPIRKRVVQDVRALQLLRFLQEEDYCPIIMQFLHDQQQFYMPEVGGSVQLDITRIIDSLEKIRNNFYTQCI
jgi:hypothetical protein